MSRSAAAIAVIPGAATPSSFVSRISGFVALVIQRRYSHGSAGNARAPILVGATGFEPATPCPPDRCANQAAPRPDGSRLFRADSYQVREPLLDLSWGVDRQDRG